MNCWFILCCSCCCLPYAENEMELEKVLAPPKEYLRMWPKSIEDQFEPVRYIENGCESRLFLELRQFRPVCFYKRCGKQGNRCNYYIISFTMQFWQPRQFSDFPRAIAILWHRNWKNSKLLFMAVCQCLFLTLLHDKLGEGKGKAKLSPRIG